MDVRAGWVVLSAAAVVLAAYAFVTYRAERLAWNDQDVEAWALVLRAANQYPEGLPDTLEALERHPNFPEAHYLAAVHHLYRGRTQPAGDHLEAAFRHAATVLSGHLQTHGTAPSDWDLRMPIANVAASQRAQADRQRFHYPFAPIPVILDDHGRFEIPLGDFTVVIPPIEDDPRLRSLRLSAPMPKSWARRRLPGAAGEWFLPPIGRAELPAWSLGPSEGRG